MAPLGVALEPLLAHINSIQAPEALENVVDELNALIHDLRIRQNQSNRWAHCMPDEILTEVFHIAVQDDPRRSETRPRDTEFSGSRYPQTLFAIREVCGRWHNIAYNRPQLWTMLSGHYSPAICSMLLGHSGSLPLTICILDGSDHAKAVWPFRTTQDERRIYRRVESLEIYTDVDQRKRITLACRFGLRDIGIPFLPHLVSLVYKVGPRYPGPTRSIADLVESMPDLQKLELSRVNFIPSYESSLTAHGLTTLKLLNGRIAEHMSAFVSSLAHVFPMLDTLTLHCMEDMKDIDAGPCQTEVVFHHLRHLVLRMLCAESLLAILSCLKVPSDCTVSLAAQCNYEHDFRLDDRTSTISDDESSQMRRPPSGASRFAKKAYQFIEAHLSRMPPEAVLQTAAISVHDCGAARLSLDPKHGDEEYPRWGNCLFVDDVVAPFERPQLVDISATRLKEPYDFLDDVLSMSQLQTDSVMALSVYLGPDHMQTWVEQCWARLSASFQNVRTLRLSRSPNLQDKIAWEYIGSLQARVSPQTSEGDHHSARTRLEDHFPKLEELVIFQAYKEANEDERANGDSIGGRQPLFDALNRVLKSRHQAGCPLRRLEILWLCFPSGPYPSDESMQKYCHGLSQWVREPVRTRWTQKALNRPEID